MLQYLKQESNKTFTENGAVTLKTTDSDCLDLFATVGAIRRESNEEIIAKKIELAGSSFSFLSEQVCTCHSIDQLM